MTNINDVYQKTKLVKNITDEHKRTINDQIAKVVNSLKNGDPNSDFDRLRDSLRSKLLFKYFKI